VLRGKDGWLFLARHNNVLAQYRGICRFSKQELRKWVDAMVLRKRWLADRGIPFIVVIPPNKHTVYPEKLPDCIGPVVGPTPMDQLATYIHKSGELDLVDLRKPVREAKKKGRVFFKTDSHWNDLGGFAGYREVMKRIRTYFPRVKSLEMKNFGIKMKSWKGDLVKMLHLPDNVVHETAPFLIPKFASHVRRCKSIHEKKRRGMMRYYFEADYPQLPGVLIFHDSFIWGMCKFIKESVGRTVLVHHSGLGFDTKVVEKEKPDIVIYEVVERGVKHDIKVPFSPDKNRIAIR